MLSIAQTPFFPVPVRWFELPVGTPEWGFVQPVEEDNPSGQVDRKIDHVDHAKATAKAASEPTEEPRPDGRGRFLNAWA